MTRPIALLLAAALAAPIATPAAAAQSVSAAFGNTVVITDPDGRSRKIWLNADGTWTGKSRRGLDLAGKWTQQGDKICLSQTKPRLPGRLCEQFPTEVGASLTAKDPSGKTVRLQLKKGRVTS